MKMITSADLSVYFGRAEDVAIVAPLFRLVNPDCNVAGFVKWLSQAVEDGSAALIVASHVNTGLVGYAILCAPTSSRPSDVFVEHTYASEKGVVDMMYQLACEWTSVLGAKRFVLQTKRNPAALTRRYGFEVIAYVMAKEV